MDVRAVSQTAAARFWRYVTPLPDAPGCWLWTGGMYGTGNRAYGAFGLYSTGTRTTHAHRAAWILLRGPIPPKLVVCHHCDTPECVNPAHLFLGTQKDNALDRIRKGRDPYIVACRAGHPRTPENTYLYRGERVCRICHNVWAAWYRQRHRQAINDRQRSRRKAVA